MSTQPIELPENFFMPKSEGTFYIDALAEVLQSSPEWIQDDIDVLTAGIAEHKKRIEEAETDLAERKQALAVAYTKPCNDRRVSDGPNVTGFEFACRSIEPGCQLFDMGMVGYKVGWEDAEGTAFGPSAFTKQTAWRAAFSMLDRRSGGAA